MNDLGPCPLCGRPMVPGPSVDVHHWVPKSRGGGEGDVLHRVCHRMIHRVFTEKQLADGMNTPEALRANEEIGKFVAWVRKQPPEYVDWPKRPRNARRR